MYLEWIVNCIKYVQLFQQCKVTAELRDQSD